MNKKTLKKDIKRSITHSKGRFISIMLLMMLGSFALVGLFVTGPDMRKTGRHYFKRLNAADLTVMSDYGIDNSEMEYIEKLSGIKDVEYIYLKDVTLKDTNESFRIFSKPDSISLYDLKEGKLPNKDNEIAIDYGYRNKYKLGDYITFTEKLSDESSEYTLKRHKYKVVGYVYSSEILARVNKGATTVGTGELNSYAVVTKNNFNSDVYMMAKITFKDTYNLNPYSKSYTKKVTKHKKELDKLLLQQQDTRLTIIKASYQKQINNAKEELEKAKEELENTRNQIETARTEINSAKVKILNGQNKLKSAKVQIESAEKQINENSEILNNKEKEYNNSSKLLSKKQAEYDSSLNLLNQKENEISTAKKEIAIAKNKLYSSKTSLENIKSTYENNIQVLEQNINKIELVMKNDSLSTEELIEYQNKLDELNSEYNALSNDYNEFLESTYNSGINEINKSLDEINLKEKEISTSENTLNENKNKLQDAKTELDIGYSSLKQARTTLDSAKETLSLAIQKLNYSKDEYNSSLRVLNNSILELNEKEEEFNTKLEEFETESPSAINSINEADDEIALSQKKVDNLEKPTYSIYTRREIPGSEGYTVYSTIADIVDSLAKIFPVFLYFVAALVTFTTMTRFVNEERINSGTLKSLGYNDRDIIKKFTTYGLIAGTTGTILGIILGHTLLPYIVNSAFDNGFAIPPIEYHFYPSYTILALLLSICSSVLPAYVVSKKELQEKPADLLLPKSPKAGSKILLEKIKPIWSKMNFTHKVTARNIFRYKSRMLMTIFGVAGATAILFTGFSVQASIREINNRQFGDIIKYDIIVAKNSDLSDKEKKEYAKMLNNKSVKSNIPLFYEAASIVGTNSDTEEIKVIVPESDDNFRDYINLINRKSKKKLSLKDGVIISERLADLLDLKVGSTFTYTDSHEIKRKVKVSGICEMYTGHFIFMNSKTYEDVYNTNYSTNSNLILLKNGSIKNTRYVASEFMKLSSVKGIVSNTTLYNQIQTIVKSLDMIMKVLIVIASLLSIVIIYNLTNINVSERIRELSTIKVLGFRDKEVTMYIYRETIVLSLIAIVVGWIIGLILHSYILEIVPPDEVMFNPAQWIGSFIIPLVIIILVSFILGIYIHHKLQNIDMLEALKSVD